MPVPSPTIHDPLVLSEAQGLRLRAHWGIDPELAFLNHGSFGACPIAVLQAQSDLRARMERDPVRFMVDDLERMLDDARSEIGSFLGSDPADLAFVPNATAGVNAVVRSLDFRPGDEIVTTDHAYNACVNALRFVADRSGARVVIARIPIPVASDDAIAAPILAAISPRTRLVMIDAITSPTAIVFPVARLVREIQSRGVDVLLDAAHAAGMIELHLDAIGAAYTTGNFHKWTCAPKGAGFLHVRRDRHHAVRPAVISHGANSTRTDRSRFLLEFDWTGTADPTPYLCVPHAIRAVGGMLPGGWCEVMERNRASARFHAMRIADSLGITPVAPDAMVGSIASLMLPDADRPTDPVGGMDPVHFALQNEFRIQVPVFPWPASPHRLIRISAHLHNRPSDYDRLIDALPRIVPGLRRG